MSDRNLSRPPGTFLGPCFALGVGLLLGVGLVLLSSALEAQRYYLNVAGPEDSRAAAINEEGQIVGNQEFISAHGLSAQRAFVWTPFPAAGLEAGVTVLPSLGGLSVEARDLNDQLQVVGWSEIPRTGGTWEFGVYRGFLWDQGVMTELPPTDQAYFFSGAYGINESGEVVGTQGAGFNCEPMLWLQQPAYGYSVGPNILPAPAGFGDGLAYAINEQGQIAGFASTACDTGSRAMALWLPEAALGLPAGAHQLSPDFPGAEGQDVNDAGALVGRGDDATFSSRAILWRGQGVEYLDQPPLTGVSGAAAVNEEGVIVGRDSSVPTVWFPEGPVAAESLLAPGSSWSLSRLADINDQGQIAGTGELGGERYAVVLSPFPFVPFFADGFESGDLSGWDLVLP